MRDKFKFWGPIIQYKSQAGLAFVERISVHRRFWNVWGNIGAVLTYIGLPVSFLLIIQGMFSVLTSPESQVIKEPQNMLAIPGVNDFLPLAALIEIILALAITLVVHEGGHAILCRANDIKIKSTGLLLLLGLPIGAFVEPDEESLDAAEKWPRIQMFAAGIMNNIVITIMLFAIFMVLISAVAPSSGVAVGGITPDSSADLAGIDVGDQIVSLNGHTVSNVEDIENEIARANTESSTVTLSSGETVELQPTLLVSGAVVDDTLPEAGATIVSVNGEQIHTTDGFVGVIEESPTYTAVIQTKSGEEYTINTGARITPQSDSGASRAGLPVGDTVTVVAVGDDRTVSSTEFISAIEERQGQSDVDLTVINSNGEVREYSVPTDDGNLGVSVSVGVDGVILTHTGIDAYPAAQYLSLLTVESFSLQQIGLSLFSILFLPFAGLVTGTGMNFPGFTPLIQSHFIVSGGDAFTSSILFFVLSTLFWTVWLNINIAIFNCLPTYALDGGHILGDTIDILMNRLSIADGPITPNHIAHLIKLPTVVAILLIMFGPLLLG